MLKEFPKEIQILQKMYKEKYKEKPRGWKFSEETLKEYQEYLEKALTKK